MKVRDGLMDMKLLEAVDGDGLEQWRPALKAEFPLAAAGVRGGVRRARHPAPRSRPRGVHGRPALGELIDPDPALRAVEVHKHRERFTVGGAMAELSEVRVAEGARRTIAIESEDASLVVAAVRELGLPLRPNVCLARGPEGARRVRRMRYAVIDVGTSSVKFVIANGPRTAHGRRWSTGRR